MTTEEQFRHRIGEIALTAALSILSSVALSSWHLSSMWGAMQQIQIEQGKDIQRLQNADMTPGAAREVAALRAEFNALKEGDRNQTGEIAALRVDMNTRLVALDAKLDAALARTRAK